MKTIYIFKFKARYDMKQKVEIIKSQLAQLERRSIC